MPHGFPWSRVKNGFIEADENNKVTEEELMDDLKEKIMDWVSDVYDTNIDSDKLLDISNKLMDLVGIY